LRRSNERPNLHYCVQEMEYSKSSYYDLAFLIPLHLEESHPMPESFVVYCNSRDEAKRSAEFLRSRVCKALCHKIIWIHSGMSDKHKLKVVEDFRDGKLIGITSTESLGLGHDLHNVTRLVQYCPPDNLNTLTQ
ncbi:uncharacterized protein EI90DRAFT_2819648, partial [Cantharellus anzutake]|uniref:uncharacterized protein n=1 Tax=Cantharellus anzutake TaxID=1750568 RepID=UPI00190471DB